MTSLRRPVLAATIAAALACPFLLGTTLAAAPTKVRVGVDKSKNVSFSIDGRTIDVTLRPDADGKANALAAQLSGAGVVVACKGTSPKRGRVQVGDMETAWPVGEVTMHGRLSHDISDDPQWCVLEQPDGTDIAVTRKLRAPKPDAGTTP